jgi:hypothetical protein
MTRFKIDLILTDNFHLFAENETDAKIEALRRIRVGAFPFDDKHPLRFSDFEIQTIKRG